MKQRSQGNGGRVAAEGGGSSGRRGRGSRSHRRRLRRGCRHAAMQARSTGKQQQQVQDNARRERLPAMCVLGATLEMAGLPVTRRRRGVDPGRGGQALGAGERLGTGSWGSGSREADPMELVPRRAAACCWPGADDEALIRRGSCRQRRQRLGGAGGQGGSVLIEAEVAGSSGSRCAKQWTAPSSYMATEHGGVELQGTGDGSGEARRIWRARGSGGHHDAGVLL